MQFNEKKNFTIAKYVLLVGTSLILIWVLLNNLAFIWGAIKKLYGILRPFVYGFVFAYLLKPIVNWLEKRIFVFVSITPKIQQKTVERSVRNLIKNERKIRSINLVMETKIKRKDLKRHTNVKKSLSLDEIEIEKNNRKKLKDLIKLYVDGYDSYEKEDEKSEYQENIEKCAFHVQKEILLEKKTRRYKKTGRILSIITTYLVIFGIISGFIYVLVPSIISSLSSLIQQAPVFVSKMEGWANWLQEQELPGNFSIPTVSDLSVWIEGYKADFTEIATNSLPWILNRIVGITSSIFTALIGMVVSIYILFNKDIFLVQAKKIVCALLSKEKAKKVFKITKMVDESFGGFINSRIMTSILLGIICFLGMKLLGLPYAVLISFVVALTNPLPYVGPFIGGIPSALLILMVDPIKAAIFVVYIFVLQQLEGNVLSVIIAGKKTGMSAFWVMFSVMLGGGLFGFWGMFIGVPFFAVFYALGGESIREKLNKKGCTQDVEEYLSEEEK